MRKSIIFAIFVLMLLIVSGCGKKECETETCSDGDPCTRDVCDETTNWKCEFRPIPGCSSECGICAGTVGNYMEEVCDPVQKKCVADVKADITVDKAFSSNELSSFGNKMRMDLQYNNPFNMKRDLLEIDITLKERGQYNSDIQITSIEVTATNENRQTVTVAEKDVNKYLWNVGSTLNEELRLDFPTGKLEGLLKNPKITVNYEYKQTIGSSIQQKTAKIIFLTRNLDLEWIMPEMTYSCPESCDDGNPGTTDTCSAATDYFCEHTPKPNECGNFICDSDENKCTCAADCGPCEGSAGQYMSLGCVDEECVAQMEPGFVQEPVSVFEDKNLNFFSLQNTYSYKSPFNVDSDMFTAEFSLYTKQETVGAVKIEAVRLMEGQKQLAANEKAQNLGAPGSSVVFELPSPVISGYESSITPIVKVWYEYQVTVGDTVDTRKGNFQKSLVKTDFINPG